MQNHFENIENLKMEVYEFHTPALTITLVFDEALV